MCIFTQFQKMHYILHKSNFVEQENYPGKCMDIVSFPKIIEIAEQIMIQTVCTFASDFA